MVIVVAESVFRKGEPVFKSFSDGQCVEGSDDEDALAEIIRRSGARFAVVGSRVYRRALYSALPAGGVIARFGVGHDGIDKVQATNSRLLCTNTPDVLNQSVAEFTVLMILRAARHTEPGTEIAGKTLAVIGCGNIGRAVVTIASDGFRMKAACIGREDDFGAAVSEADFVSLHIPATPDNTHFMNRERLALLKKHAWLINTSRGIVVDEAAMYDALAEHRLAGVALDVVQNEPYQPVDPTRDLRHLPNVILTPHIGSNTAEANRRMAGRALRNIQLSLAGNYAAMDLLNREVLLKL